MTVLSLGQLFDSIIFTFLFSDYNFCPLRFTIKIIIHFVYNICYSFVSFAHFYRPTDVSRCLVAGHFFRHAIFANTMFCPIKL